MSRIPEGATPRHQEQVFAIPGQVEVPDAEGASGMIITQGGLFGGYGLYLEKGGRSSTTTSSTWPIPRSPAKDATRAGEAAIGFDFTYDGGGIGKGRLRCSRSTAGRSPGDGSSRLSPFRITLDEGLDIGEDTGTPVDLALRRPVPVPGEDRKVTID